METGVFVDFCSTRCVSVWAHVVVPTRDVERGPYLVSHLSRGVAEPKTDAPKARRAMREPSMMAMTWVTKE